MSNIKKLQLISLLGGMYYYTPIFTLFLLERGITLGMIVALNTVFSITYVLSVVPTGILADKFGQKIAIQLGLFLDALSMFGLLFISNVFGLILFFAVRGISVGFRHGSDEALLYESYIEEHKSSEGYVRSYGKLVSNDVLGFVIATAISGIALYMFGRVAYVPLITATVITTLLTLLLASTLINKHSRKHTESLDTWTHIKQGVTIIKKDYIIFALTLAGLLTLSGEYFLRQTYQPFFQDMAVPALFLGIALSAGKLLNFFAIRNSHRLEKFFTVGKILFGLNGLLGVLFVFFALTQSPWALVVLFIAIQTLFSTTQPIVSDYVNQQIGSEKRSTVLSSISLIQNLGEIVARLFLSISIGLIGLSSTFLVQGIYLILGASIALWYITRCGCVHRVKHSTISLPEVTLVQ